MSSLRKTTVPVALAVLAVLLAGPHPAHGQFGGFGDPVEVAGYASLSSAPQGGSIRVAVALRIAGRWHVNAHRTNDEFLIPTTIDFNFPEGITEKGRVYPAIVEKKLGFSDQPLLLYEGESIIGAELDVAPDIPLGEYAVTATVTYQACDNQKCLAPETRTVTIPIVVSSPNDAVDLTHGDLFERIDFGSLSSDTPTSGGSGRLGTVVAGHGLFVAFLLVFVWGLALNLTPCVYPIIPITVGYFGGQSGGRTGRTFMLAAVYVLGMAIMYSTLGLVAALTGSLLGTALQNPIVIVFVALVLVGLALSMFGVYEFRVPAALSNIAGASSGRQGPVGALLMGLTVGIVAAPCIGPFVLALLTFVGESGNPLLGFSLFFTLAIGLGLPFLFLAVLSGSITRLPRSGEWMEWVKKLFGVILVAMAIFFMQPLIFDPFYFAAMGVLFIAGGIFLGFLKKTQTKALFFIVFKRFVGIAGPLFGLYLLLNPGHIIARDAPDQGVVWTPYDDALLGKARSEEQYVVIDFAAEWCLPCKELDHRTFSQPEVIEATRDFVNLRADLTRSASQDVAKLRQEYSIKGVPTIVFLDRDGKERKDLRVFGFVDKDAFLDRVKRLKEDA